MNNEQPTMYALLVGINTYPNLHISGKLDGCVNDTKLLKGILQGPTQRSGYPPSNQGGIPPSLDRKRASVGRQRSARPAPSLYISFQRPRLPSAR